MKEQAMKFRASHSGVSVSLFAAFVLFVSGCGQTNTSGPAQRNTSQVADTGSGHSGWWCPEHGVPEEECSMCSTKAATEFKKKGDWCKEHDRAESQCFICDPSTSGKFAARYEAKYCKKPPTPDDKIRETDDTKYD
jgi:hypothetical protein